MLAIIPISLVLVIVATLLHYLFRKITDDNSIEILELNMMLIATVCLLLGIVLLWIVNSTIIKYEGLTQPSALDHIRISGAYYVFFIFIITLSGGLIFKEVGDFSTVLPMTLLAPIIVNAIFLYRLHKKNIS